MLAPYEDVASGNLSFTGSKADLLPDPIAVGAVGGSGTRVLANILSEAGVAMASPLNRAGDAMEWPPFRRLLTPERLQQYPRELLMKNILHAFESLLLTRRSNLGLCSRVSWKVPGTFLWLQELTDYFPEIQYVHLIRNGLDMAYSDNQNQISNWAHRFDLDAEFLADGVIRPRSKLEYWLRANEHALEVGKKLLGERLILVRFEDLCANPETEIQRILELLGLATGSTQVAEMASLIKAPESLGRYRDFDWQQEFSPEQLARLEKLGY